MASVTDRQRTHDHYEENGILIEPEPEQGQRPPADAGQALQTHEQSAHGLFQEFAAGHAQPENHAEHHGNAVADQDTLHADADRDPVGVILESGVQGLADAPGRGKQVRRPDL
jgi:hypothetical protein